MVRVPLTVRKTPSTPFKDTNSSGEDELIRTIWVSMKAGVISMPSNVLFSGTSNVAYTNKRNTFFFFLNSSLRGSVVDLCLDSLAIT
jgi:hypothetical protein